MKTGNVSAPEDGTVESNKTMHTIIVHSHNFAAASDCALYLRDTFHHLSHSKFSVKSVKLYQGTQDNYQEHYMWQLTIVDDLDRIKNVLDVAYTSEVVGVARAFITGRGGMAMPANGAVFF